MTDKDLAGGWEMKVPSEDELRKIVVRIFFMIETRGSVEYLLEPDPKASAYAKEVYVDSNGKASGGLIGYGSLNPLIIHLMNLTDLKTGDRTPQNGSLSVKFRGKVFECSIEVEPCGREDRRLRLKILNVKGEPN